MKQFFLLFAALLLINATLTAQWTGSTELYHNLWRYGNIGIGTNNPNASVSGTLLEINANGDIFPVFRLDRENGIEKQNASYDFFIGSSGDLGIRNNGAGYPILMKNGMPAGTIGLAINNDGNVGIGTDDPKDKIDVVGYIRSKSGIRVTDRYSYIENLYNSNGQIIVRTKNNLGEYVTNMIYSASQSKCYNTFSTVKEVGIGIDDPTELLHLYKYQADNGIRIQGSSAGWTIKNMYTDGGALVFAQNGTPFFRISKDGKVIVENTLEAKEIKVVSNPGADFVFTPEYNLRSLEEVETFINENKHLPEVASAKEMEEDGVLQSKMNQTLLQKIEELTLYMIEQNKKSEKLLNRVDGLESENKKLKEKINTLEAL